VTIRTINNINELAEELFALQSDWEGDNASFAASLISCAVTVAHYDGLTPDAIRQMVMNNAQAAIRVNLERKARQQA